MSQKTGTSITHMEHNQKKSIQSKPTRQYTLQDKIDFIRNYDNEKKNNPHISNAAIFKKLAMKYSTATDILAKRDEIIAQVGKLHPAVLKTKSRLPQRRWQAVEDIVKVWIKRSYELGVNVTDARIKGTALVAFREIDELYDHELGKDVAAFSNGWLRNFKGIANLRQYVGHGGSGDVDLSKVQSAIITIMNELAAFEPENIYNCDETGLYLRTMPNKTITTGPIQGRKVVRSARVSILFCSNATGSDKRKPFILSKFRPVSLSEQTLSHVDAHFGSSGYMSIPLFHNWLQKVDDDMRIQGRKIAMVIDNADCHNESENIGLTNITIVRLPPNSTSLTQPLDAGIIRSFKVLYSQQMLEITAPIRDRSRSRKHLVQIGKLWQAITDAWNDVSPDCIRNCFVHFPILVDRQKSFLRELGVETRADQIERLQMDLEIKYGNTTSKQKDFTVLNYLKTNDSCGPSDLLMESMRTVLSMPEHQGSFRPRPEANLVEEEMPNSVPINGPSVPNNDPSVSLSEEDENDSSSQDSQAPAWLHELEEPLLKLTPRKRKQTIDFIRAQFEGMIKQGKFSSDTNI